MTSRCLWLFRAGFLALEDGPFGTNQKAAKVPPDKKKQPRRSVPIIRDCGQCALPIDCNVSASRVFTRVIQRIFGETNRPLAIFAEPLDVEIERDSSTECMEELEKNRDCQLREVINR